MQFFSLRLVSRFCLFITIFALFLKADIFDFISGNMPLWDFDVYYQTARDVLRGYHPYELPYMQTAGPPLVIAPFLLFAFVPTLQIGRSIMTILSLAAGAATCYILAKKMSKKYSVEISLVLFIALLISFPFRFTLLLGQPNAVSMLIVALVCMQIKNGNQAQKNQPSSSRVTLNIALLLAGIGMIKTNFLVWWLAFIKSHRALLVYTGLLIVLLFIMLSPILKPRYYIDYLTQRTGGYSLSEVTLTDVDYYNQSLRSTLGRFGWGEYAPVVFITTAIVGGLYLVVSGDVLGGVVLSLLLSPIVWQHYVIVVYPLFILIALDLWKMRLQNRQRLWFFQVALLTVSIILLTIELPLLHGAPLGGWRSILASHYFFGLVLLYITHLTLQKNPQKDPRT